MNITEIKVKGGKFRYPVMQAEMNGRLYFKFGFNKKVMEEIKAMQGRTWHGPVNGTIPKPAPKEVTAQFGTHIWSIPATQRNLFQLAYLKGEKPYAHYDLSLVDVNIEKRCNSSGIWIDPYNHQKEMIRFVLTRHYCILAAEMGTGKTLVAIYVMELAELAPDDEVWYIAPRSALRAVEREFRLWKAKVKPKFMTYEELVKLMKVWEVEGRQRAPRMLWLDESSRVKNPTAQRSQAALKIASYVREDWGPEGYVVEMSGSPAPKAPTDWWHQCEIACPGFLREGTWEMNRNRLGLIVEKENTITGGVFPQLVTYRDSADKCHVCGKTKQEHDLGNMVNAEDIVNSHDFIKSTNEVALLYERMKGLVLVKFKKECLRELPDKIYRQVRLKPKPEMLRAAKIIQASAAGAAEKLIRWRELSDGFQYEDVETGMKQCPRCHGTKRVKDFVPKGELPEIIPPEQTQDFYEEQELDCPYCNALGEVPHYSREAIQIETPKEDAIRDLLDEHEDVGRIVLYAGFQGSVDRLVKICQSEKWGIIRWDGRGVQTLDQNGANVPKEPLDVFQDLLDQYPRVAFIGQPGAAGMGLTLTRSPTICYYSNDFNAESRIQSEDRIHRPGMDVNKGATIIDLFCLASDEHVWNNLQAKRRLQEMTLTGIDFDAWNNERIY